MNPPHTRLEVWQQAMDIAPDIYRLTGCFPADERFGLTAQLRRAAVSVPSSIAEGPGRDDASEFAYVLTVARGSLRERETQLELASRLGFSPAPDLDRVPGRCASVARQITALIAAKRPATRNGTAPSRPRNAGVAGTKLDTP